MCVLQVCAISRRGRAKLDAAALPLPLVATTLARVRLAKKPVPVSVWQSVPIPCRIVGLILVPGCASQELLPKSKPAGPFKVVLLGAKGCGKTSLVRPRGPVAVHLFVHTEHSQKAGPFSAARLKMDPPLHNRLADNRVHKEKCQPSCVLASVTAHSKHTSMLSHPDRVFS